MVQGRKAADLPPLVHGASGLEALDHEAVSAVFPLRHEGWVGGNNLQRPSEEEAGWQIGTREWGRRRGARGSDHGHIYRKAQQPSRSIRGRYTAG